MWLNRLHDDEDGIALIFALFAVLTIAGLVALIMATALTEQTVTGDSRDFENAVHVAESGADDVVSDVNLAAAYTTAGPSGSHTYTLPAGATVEQQRAWALTVAETNCELVVAPDGESCGIRPVSASGVPLDVVYGVGFVPSRSDPQKVRVVRMEYDRGFFSSTKALLTGDDLVISGNPDILGLAGHVHTNGGLKVSGSANVAGDLTFTGTLIEDKTGKAVKAPSEPIPDVTARSVYTSQSGSYPGQWYDLCPDGRVRSPAASPCTGTEVWNAQTAEFRGWKYNKSSNSTAKWDVSGNTVGDGIYYIYRGNASISGNPGTKSKPAKMSVILERTKVCATTPDDDGSLSGNFTMSGNMVWQPLLADAMVIADTDIEVSGNPNQSLEGAMIAREQVKVSGNPQMEGSMIAQDACDLGGSPVHENSISGNMMLTHNGDLLLPIDGLVRVTAWNELD